MVIMKFGGTSIQNSEAMNNVCKIIQDEIKTAGKTPMVIVSACSGITNKLVSLSENCEKGNLKISLKTLHDIKAHHETIVEELIENEQTRRKLSRKIGKIENNIKRMLRAIYAIGECPNSLKDQIVSNGELLSSSILSERMKEVGIKTVWVDARKILTTDSCFTKAKVRWNETEKKVLEILNPYLENGNVVLSQGFIGSSINGKTTTIGRGGSDYSAAIFGSMLNVKAIQIWTDVDGVLTADPRIVSRARRLKQMTFNEAAELAYSGAKVLHPATIYPAVKKNIPVYVLNSKRPHVEGTLITQNTPNFHGLVKAIASKKNQTIINLTSIRMLGTVGFLYSIAKIFAENEVPIDMVSTSEISISITVGSSETHLTKVISELSKIAEVKRQDHTAIICVVGDRLHQTSGVAAKIFRTVAEKAVNIIMISQGASERNVGFVVEEKDADTVVKALHRKFLTKVNQEAIFA